MCHELCGKCDWGGTVSNCKLEMWLAVVPWVTEFRIPCMRWDWLWYHVTSFTFLTGFKKFKTVLFGSSTGLPNSVTSHLFYITRTGSQFKKRIAVKLTHFPLNLLMVLPLPTPQTLFTFTLLLGSSVLLQTAECSEYPPFAQSQVVSALSLTKLQHHGTHSPLLFVTHPRSVPSNLPWKPFSFWKLFLQSPCP